MGDRNHLRAKNLHSCDIRRLLRNVYLAHVDLTFQAEERGCRSQGDAVLSCAGLGDEPLLAHELCKKALAHTVVQLMGAGVI